MELSEQRTKRGCAVCGREFLDGSITVCPDDRTPLTPLAHLDLVNSVLADKYAILERIGHGGMGQVYKAQHILMKRIVAIKVLLPSLVSSGPTLKRFQQEAEAASNLNHPNIFSVYDFGITSAGLPYMVMDYLEGTTLHEVLAQEGHLNAQETIHIFSQVASGVGHAHQKGVIHRDLKPSNIMLVQFEGQTDFVKIFDFGIAKLLPQEGDESRHLTQTGDLFGSPLYMSPEQCKGVEIDLRSDIYSLGCVMYKTLTGTYPVSGQSLSDCIYKHINVNPATFNDACPELDIPKELEDIVFKAMAKEREDRFQTMLDLKNALREISYPTPASTAKMASIIQRVSATLKPVPSEPISVTPTSQLGPADREKLVASAATREPSETASAETGSAPVQQTTAAPLTESPAASTGATQSSIPTVVDGAIKIDSTASTPSLETRPTTVENAGTHAQVHTSASNNKVLITLVIVLLLGVIFLFMRSLSATKTPTPTLSPGNQINAPEGSLPQSKYERYIAEADAAYKNGKTEQAAPYYQLAIQEAQAAGNKGDAKLALALSKLGQLHFEMAHYDEAKSELQNALSLQGKQKSTKDASQQVGTLTNLGMVYIALNKSADAEQVLKKALSLAEKAPDDPKQLGLASVQSALGYLAMKQHKFDNAITYLKRSLDIRQKALGNDNLDIASSLTDLGQAYQLAGRNSEAEPLYQKALQIRQTKLDKENPLVADALYYLGALLVSEHKVADGKKLLEQSIDISQKLAGPTRPSLSMARDLLSKLGSSSPNTGSPILTPVRSNPHTSSGRRGHHRRRAYDVSY